MEIENARFALYLVSFIPKTHDVPFRRPRTPARSRYCASPEASIMRLKAAAKLGATAGAPTQHSDKLQHY